MLQYFLHCCVGRCLIVAGTEATMLFRGVLRIRRAAVRFDRGVVGVAFVVVMVLTLREEYVLDDLFLFPVVLN